MQALLNKVRVFTVLLVVGCCFNTAVFAQTPADDPGIGGPGVGAAPAGDGSPIVPFDGNMTLLFFAAGVVVVGGKLKAQKVEVSL